MDILVVGSANVDEVFALPHIVRPGETIASTSYERSVGGKGVNSAISARRAGAAVHFCGAIGPDGEIVREALTNAGVQLDHLHVVDSSPTGRAVIQVANDGENSIVLLPGANFDPSVPSPPTEAGRLVLLQNEIPLDRTIATLDSARAAGTITVLNPSPLPRVDERERVPWDKVDWLLVNEEEAKELGAAVTSRCGAVVTTLGKRGAEIRRKGEHDTLRRPAGNVGPAGVVDTTGAGDCFTGYFASLLLKLPDPKRPQEHQLLDILRIANQAAAMSVEKKGAATSMPLLRRVQARLAEGSVGWPA